MALFVTVTSTTPPFNSSTNSTPDNSGGR